ncbi:MAG TPA: (d)CMP kinase [Candidatus Babeliales bacterium]|nr:(d)CMP kinase [Candidatus Babeliales bacterium]
MIITIDGPTASGKSTVGRILAHKLGFYYVCSGLMYRAIAYVLINHCGCTLETLNDISIEKFKQYIDSDRFTYTYNEESQEHIFFDNNDVTAYLKDTLIDRATSIISINKNIRSKVTSMQRAIAANHNIVIDGRDVGSVVFPQAEIKFFITASLIVRASRWRKDQQKYNHFFSIEESTKFITERDERDKNRIIAPLIVPKDAIILDTSSLNAEETVSLIMSHISNYQSNEIS